MSALPTPSEPTQLATTVPLEVRRERIMAVLERTALDIGVELLAAKDEHPGEFVAWVELSLPFGLDKAERLMAITRTFATCDESTRQFLPPAWSALYELTRLPSDRLRQAIDVGEVRPDMTVAAAKALVRANPGESSRGTRLSADIVAVELTRYPRSELSPEAAARVAAWMRGSHPTMDWEDET